MRGAGLLLAAELTGPFAGPAVASALEAGLLVNAVRPDAVRLAPSLLVTDGQLAEALSVLERALACASSVAGASGVAGR